LDKHFRENQDPHFMFSNISSENLAIMR